MIVKPFQVEAEEISAVNGLDPIQVIWRDLGPGQGTVTLTCYGCAWTCYWGAMGDRTIRQFVAEADIDYIVNKMANNHPLKQSKQADKYLAKIITAVKESLKMGSTVTV